MIFPPMTGPAVPIVATVAVIAAVVAALTLGVYSAAGVVTGSVIHAALWSWADDRRRARTPDLDSARTEIHP